MRRAYTGKSDTRVATSNGEQGFWPSYADMMSSFALIIFFLMLLSYIQNLVTGNDLQNTQEVLDNTRTALVETKTQVDDAKNRLAQVQLELEDATKELTGQQQELTTQQARIDEQENYLAAANEEIRQMRSQMQTIAVLRLSILEQIRDSIVEVMGDSSKVGIGDNGNIILNEGVFFDLGSFEIKQESVPVLNQLIKVFDKFLGNSDNSKYIDSIVISGHTDDIGTEEDNRILSTNRANAVLNYLLSGDSASLSKYDKYFCAAGYGETRPVASNGTNDGRAQNRRIEISIILKDDSVMDIVNSYLDIQLPSGAASTPASAAPKA